MNYKQYIPTTRTLILLILGLNAFVAGVLFQMALDVKSINIKDLNTASNYIANAVTECEE